MKMDKKCMARLLQDHPTAFPGEAPSKEGSFTRIIFLL